MPYMFCDNKNVCSYAENNDDSLWLSSPEPMPMSMTPIPAREITNYISRCSVCETSTRIIAIHSQTMSIPDCPGGWEEMWTGYSYFMSTTDNSGGFGQNLISPGSCLEEFRANPVIECHGHGRCNYYDQLASFWLAVIEEDEQFRKPKQQTLKSDQTSKISRCSVCRKVERSLPAPVDPFPSASALTEGQRNTYWSPAQYQQPPPPPRRGQRVRAQRRRFDNNLQG